MHWIQPVTLFYWLLFSWVGFCSKQHLIFWLPWRMWVVLLTSTSERGSQAHHADQYMGQLWQCHRESVPQSDLRRPVICKSQRKASSWQRSQTSHLSLTSKTLLIPKGNTLLFICYSTKRRKRWNIQKQHSPLHLGYVHVQSCSSPHHLAWNSEFGSLNISLWNQNHRWDGLTSTEIRSKEVSESKSQDTIK